MRSENELPSPSGFSRNARKNDRPCVYKHKGAPDSPSSHPGQYSAAERPTQCCSDAAVLPATPRHSRLNARFSGLQESRAKHELARLECHKGQKALLHRYLSTRDCPNRRFRVNLHQLATGAHHRVYRATQTLQTISQPEISD